MRAIDGDALMMELADWWYSSFGEEETEEAKAIRMVTDEVQQSLDHLLIPPAQLEVIRCKECKWYDGGAYSYVRCRKRNGGKMLCTDDSYCDEAERKEDGSD